MGNRRIFGARYGAARSDTAIALANDSDVALGKARPGTHRYCGGSIDHIGLSVPDVATLRRLQTTGMTAGYQVERFIDRGWFTSLYVLEPNGYRIEFATTRPGFTLDEPLAQPGHGVALPPHLERQRTALQAYLQAKSVT